MRISPRRPAHAQSRIREKLKEDTDAGAGAEHASVSQRFAWNVQAEERDKIELVHRQLELLRQELADVRQEISQVEARLSSALERLEVRQQDAHQQLTGRLEAVEQGAARVDARGIWRSKPESS